MVMGTSGPRCCRRRPDRPYPVALPSVLGTKLTSLRARFPPDVGARPLFRHSTRPSRKSFQERTGPDELGGEGPQALDGVRRPPPRLDEDPVHTGLGVAVDIGLGPDLGTERHLGAAS